MSMPCRRARAGQRISALDEANLRVERSGVPMHVAALALLEAGPLLDADGHVWLGDVPEHVERRTRGVRQLRQVFARPGRLVNLLLSNVCGPAAPLLLAGAPVRELFQLGAVQGNLALSVGAVSYAGTLGLDVVADADVVPDLPVFVEGLAGALVRLGAGPPPPDTGAGP
ncbi:WS/DGAT domain-containing protein [Kocuria arenosa]|uniref:WS/DGAT domain-containing protein n=1 Tax=Kocuria arenosa TaxID=3071446 RepID=UPI0034D5BDAC